MTRVILACPCGFSAEDELWRKTEWMYEGCPECGSYDFLKKPRLYDTLNETEKSDTRLAKHGCKWSPELYPRKNDSDLTGTPYKPPLEDI